MLCISFLSDSLEYIRRKYSGKNIQVLVHKQSFQDQEISEKISASVTKSQHVSFFLQMLPTFIICNDGTFLISKCPSIKPLTFIKKKKKVKVDMDIRYNNWKFKLWIQSRASSSCWHNKISRRKGGLWCKCPYRINLIPDYVQVLKVYFLASDVIPQE